MAEPFIFMSVSTIKEGKLEEYEDFMRKTVEIIKANEPRLLAFSTYANEEGTNVTTIQVHPDVESMMFHMQVLKEKIESAFEFLDITSITICGELNDQVLEMVQKIAGSGVTLNINPKKLGGFSRLIPG